MLKYIILLTVIEITYATILQIEYYFKKMI